MPFESILSAERDIRSFAMFSSLNGWKKTQIHKGILDGAAFNIWRYATTRGVSVFRIGNLDRLNKAADLLWHGLEIQEYGVPWRPLGDATIVFPIRFAFVWPRS
jgi:hypothetical protein